MTNSMLFKDQRQIVFFLKNLKWKKNAFFEPNKRSRTKIFKWERYSRPKGGHLGQENSRKKFQIEAY